MLYCVIASFQNYKKMNVEEIAHKYVHGLHNALTDSQEKKDLANDIMQFAKAYNKQILSKIDSNTFKEELHTAIEYGKGTDYGFDGKDEFCYETFDSEESLAEVLKVLKSNLL